MIKSQAGLTLFESEDKMMPASLFSILIHANRLPLCLQGETGKGTTRNESKVNKNLYMIIRYLY